MADLEHYDYMLPPERIRKKPLEPCDSTRLFVYDTRTNEVQLDIFKNLANYLPPESLMVLNNTRVLPARLFLQKETGGKIEVLVLANEIENPRKIPIIVDRKIQVGQKIFFPGESFFEVLDQSENVFTVKLESQKTLFQLLEEYGTTPVPHYLEGKEKIGEDELRRRYQTVFASAGASVAAPTASLHFTEEVFHSLETKGITRQEITLNVGLGTFAPLSEGNFVSGKLHTEYVVVSEKAALKINAAKDSHRPVLSVGTTVTRTLEGLGHSGTLAAYTGPLNIFIHSPYNFRIVDMLLTNFHLPKTSLMLLVDAFLQNKGAQRGIVSLYEEAIDEKFSFYSFGDSMLIL